MNSFSSLWEDEDFADVIFYVGNESVTDVWRIAAHTLVLSKQSKIFMKHFSKLAKEYEDKKKEPFMNNNLMEIFINDIPPDIFNQFVRYFYTNELHIDSINSTVFLHYAACKYEVEAVRDIIIEYLRLNINSKTHLFIKDSFTEYINKVRYLPLQRICLHFDHKYANEVLQTNAFTHLRQKEIIHLVLNCGLNLSSDQIPLEALFRWSVAECRRRQIVVNDGNKRLVLEQIINRIRFKAETVECIIEKYFDKGLINKKDKKKILSKVLPKAISVNSHPCYCSLNCCNQNYFTVCRFKGTILFEKENIGEPIREHCMAFTSDSHLLLKSVIFFGHESDLNCTNQPSILRVIKHFNIIKEIAIKNPTFINTFKYSIDFPECLHIEPNTTYILHASMLPSYNIVDAEDLLSGNKWSFEEKEGFIQWLECDLPGDGENCSSILHGQLFQLLVTW